MNARALRYCMQSLLCAAACTLSGCASTHIAPQPIDVPLARAPAGMAPCLHVPSQGTASVPVPEQGTAGASKVLLPGQSCWFIVQADVHFAAQGNHTGLQTRQGEIYEITVPAQQFWYDKTRKVPAPMGDEGEGITKLWLVERLKHQRAQRWFTLMAATDTNPSHDRALLEPQQCIPAHTGALYFYANDASRHYANNQGRILLWIRRVV